LKPEAGSRGGVVALLLLASSLGADEFLLAPHFRGPLVRELSGELAKEHVIAISRHHRVQASPGYWDAARYVLETLKAQGFFDARIEGFKSDGFVRYQTWPSPVGWRVRDAELWVLEPEERLLCRYSEVPMSLVTLSRSAFATAPLVDVGTGEAAAEYEGKDVRGKIVLATGYGGTVHREAVIRRGAKGVVCFLDDERAHERPDLVQYTGMWPTGEEREQVGFGFNLGRRDGERLRGWLRAGKTVTLRAHVDGGELFDGRLEVVTASLPGSEPDAAELLLIAHLDHPKESANDNASGSAALLEMARALRRIAYSDKLPALPGRPSPLRRTIRFVWVPEWFGTMAWVNAHPELGQRTLAAVNLDMVGEDLERLHSALQVVRTPASLPSFLNDLVADLTRWVDSLDVRSPRGGASRFNYRIVPYQGGSDHMMLNDGALRIPTVMLSHAPDFTHHTSLDTPDFVDPVELKRSMLIALGTAVHLSSLDDQDGLRLLSRVGNGALARLAETADRTARRVTDAETSARGGVARLMRRALEGALERELEGLASVLAVRPSSAVARAFEGFRERLQAAHVGALGQLDELLRTLGGPAAPDEPTPEEAAAVALTLHRATRGPIHQEFFLSRLAPERAAFYRGAAAPDPDLLYEIVNLVNGKRSALAIRDRLLAEGPVELAIVTRTLTDLRDAGLLHEVVAGKGNGR